MCVCHEIHIVILFPFPFVSTKKKILTRIPRFGSLAPNPSDPRFYVQQFQEWNLGIVEELPSPPLLPGSFVVRACLPILAQLCSAYEVGPSSVNQNIEIENLDGLGDDVLQHRLPEPFETSLGISTCLSFLRSHQNIWSTCDMGYLHPEEWASFFLLVGLRCALLQVPHEVLMVTQAFVI